MDISQTLLDVIDKRIDSYLKSSKVVCRYTGKIISKEQDNFYKVNLLGYNTIFTFPARAYIDAKEGDYVLIESKLSNLSNGIISDVLNN